MKKLLFGVLLVMAFFMFGGAALIPYIGQIGVIIGILLLGYEIFYKDRKVSKKDKES